MDSPPVAGGPVASGRHGNSRTPWFHRLSRPDLFFDWKSDMILTLQRVDAVVARLQADLPSTAKVETHRMTFAIFPIIGYSLASDTVPPNKLWEIATYDL